MTFVFLKACFVPGSHFAYATGFAQKRKLYKIDYGATCVVFGIYHFENFLFPRFHRTKSEFYFIAFGKPAGHREVAPRDVDVHSRWKPAREAEEKRRIRRRRRRRTRRRRRRTRRRTRRRRRRRRKRRRRRRKNKNKKGRRRQSRKTEAAWVASAGCNNIDRIPN